MAEEIMDRCPYGFLHLDHSLAVVQSNPAAARLLGIPGDHLRGLTWGPDFGGVAISIPPAALAEVLDGGCSRHFLELVGERRCDIHVSPSPAGLFLFIGDATDRFQWQAALQQESDHRRLVEVRFEAALSVTPLVVFNLDNDLKYTWVYNNQLSTKDCNCVGRSPDDLFDKKTSARLTEFFQTVLDSGKQICTELTLRPKNAGEEKTFISSAKPLLSADGRVIGLTGASVDITSIVRQREELEEARQDAMVAKAEAERASIAKSKFIAAASHDLRQPVQSLVLLLTALRNRSLEFDIIETMELAIDALRMLLDSILDIAKLDSGVVVPELEPVSLGQTILRLVEEHQVRAREKGLRLSAVASSLWTHTDRTLLERVLRNLIENALRYTQAGGVLIGCRRREGMVRIDVVDTGIGIAATECEAIFEEFHQIGNEARNRSQGLGLGLAIVKRIVTMLGGRIELASFPGRGSRFSVYLPAVPPETEASRRAVPVPVRQHRTVMLIEDDPVLRTSMSMLLEDWGYTPLPAKTGESAVAMVEDGSRPDLVVSDYRLSSGINGIETIGRIRSLIGTQLPSLVITGDTAPERVGEVLNSGLRILHKPVAAEELRRTLSTMVKERGREHRRPAH